MALATRDTCSAAITSNCQFCVFQMPAGTSEMYLYLGDISLLLMLVFGLAWRTSLHSFQLTLTNIVYVIKSNYIMPFSKVACC